jgi:hypothetical protein
MNLNNIPQTYIPTCEDLNYLQTRYIDALKTNVAAAEKYRKQYELVEDALVIYKEQRLEG